VRPDQRKPNGCSSFQLRVDQARACTTPCAVPG
jgi:hypothetical protein